MNELTLQSALRTHNRVSYWEYLVDGRRLADILNVGDFIPPIGWLGPKVEIHFLAMLLRKAPGDLAGGRVPLFVCPECADYDCGVVSCVIRRTENGITWSDFGMQQGRDGEVDEREMDASLTYLFHPTRYVETFAGHYAVARSG